MIQSFSKSVHLLLGSHLPTTCIAISYRSEQCNHCSPPRRTFFHHKSYSFLSRTVRLTNSNPKALLLGCRGTLAQNRGTMGVQIPFSFPKSLDFKPLQTKVRILPWQMNKNLIFLIFPVFSGFSNLFTFLHFSLILAYFGISLHIFVINFGKNFGKFQVCTKGKAAIGNRQVRIAYFMPSYQNYLALLCFHLRCQSFLHYLMLFSPR